MNRSALASFALGIALLAGCGDDTVPTTPPSCTPACRIGYTCVSGACVPACNPPCGAGQSCIMTTSGAVCEGPMVSDVAADSDDATSDLPGADAQPSDAAPDADDASSDQPSPTDAPLVDTPVADTPSTDAPSDVTPSDVAPMDVPIADVPSMDTPVADAPPADSGPRDVITDASAMDAPVVDTPAVDAAPSDVSADVRDAGPCGHTGEPCCQNRVCTGAAVCDTTAMRCVAYTPTMGECTSTLRCTTGEVCGGIYLCGERPCLLCVLPGAAPLGASCTNADQCASDFCANGICTATCLAGSTGDTACAAMNPRMICGQFTSRARATDAGPAPISTFGGCVTTCTRNADCATGLVCRLQRNDFFDRLDEVCSSPSGMLTPGAACDPNPPSTATSAMFCNNGQCIGTGDHTGYCAPFCATDADCPSSTYACISFMFGRPSGLPQPIRMCARR